MKVNSPKNNLFIRISPEEFKTDGNELKKAASVVAEIKNPKGEVLLSKCAFLTQDLYYVLSHPEVEKGGFTRYGNAIKDPVLRFMTGSGACMMPDHPYIKTLDAKNYPGFKHRIFDSVPYGRTEREVLQYEMDEREMIEKIAKFIKEAVLKYDISKKDVAREAKKVLKVIV